MTNSERYVVLRRRRVLFSLAIVIFGLVVIQPTLGTSTQTSPDSLWLHTSATHTYNELGQRIDLRGVNFVSGQGQGITLADVQNAKQLGFNAFRYQVYWGLIQPYDETLNGIDESYFTTGKYPLNIGLDQLVNWAVQENMYFIICLFWTQWRPPPTWAFPSMPDDAQRYAALINGTAVKERAGVVNAWKYIATRYKDIPNLLFEILNEPNVLDTSLAGDAYKTFNEQVISAMESVETRPHLKIVELLRIYGNAQEITQGASDINKSNVLWATHHYAPMSSFDPNGTYWHESFTWNGEYFPAGWGNGTTYVAWRTIRVAEKIQSWNKPWISTEFSKDVTQANWKSWYDITLKTMKEYDITGWIFHLYSRDPNIEPGWNINAPATQQEVMGALGPYLGMTQTTNQTSTTTSESAGGSSTVTPITNQTSTEFSTSQITNTTSTTSPSTTTVLNLTQSTSTWSTTFSTNSTQPSVTSTTTNMTQTVPIVTSTSNGTSTTQSSTQAPVGQTQTVTVTQFQQPPTVTSTVTVTQSLQTQTVTITQSPSPTAIISSVTITQSIIQTVTVMISSSSNSITSSSTSTVTSISSTSTISTQSSTTTSTASTTRSLERCGGARGCGGASFFIPPETGSTGWVSMFLLLTGAWLGLRLPRYWTSGLAVSSQLKHLFRISSP